MDSETLLFVIAVIADAVVIGMLIGWAIFRTWHASKVSYLESQNAVLRWQAEEAARQLEWAHWELAEMRDGIAKLVEL